MSSETHTSASTPRPDALSEGDRHPDRLTPGARRALIASTVGTIIEWFDYALYGMAAALIITPLFFPDSLSGAGDMAAFATFAVGFIARPIGGVIISHIGDRYGRRPALVLTIALMGLATVGIGLLPTAETLGIWAPALLVVLRILQGFGAGAELAGAMTVVAEFAPPKRRGFYTSIVLAAPPAGGLLATLAFLSVSSLPTETLLGWAWRVPFLASGVLFFIALWIREKMGETPEFQAVLDKQEERRHESVPLGALLRSSWRQVLTGFFAITGHNVNYYLLATFSVSFLIRNAGMDRTEAIILVSIGSFLGMVMTPAGGMLTDRYGARKVMIVGMGVGALYAYPLFMALASGNVAAIVAMFAVGFGFILMTTSAPQGALLTGLFPAEYRYSGVAVARELNGVAAAGTAPIIAAALVAANDGGITYAAGYMVFAFLVSFIALIVARNADRVA
ncbi:MAG: MFS transporter [Dermatophilus congolensis]|nr:MFS transporter [Dermatophilus congolensis]